MFCHSCGSENAQGLSYCSRCGTALFSGKSAQANAIGETIKSIFGTNKPPELAEAENLKAITHPLATVNVIGLGILFAGALVLKKDAAFAESLLRFFMASVLFVLTFVDLVLGIQLWRITSNARARRLSESEEQRGAQAELAGTPPRSLSEGVPSVTEHTTRSFDSVYRTPRG